MNKKVPFFLISGIIPMLFLSAGYQNTAYFKLNNYDNYEIKSEFANFSLSIWLRNWKTTRFI